MMTEAADLLDEWNGLADEWDTVVAELKSKTRRCATVDAYCRAYNAIQWRTYDVKYDLLEGTEYRLNCVKKHIGIFKKELSRLRRAIDRETPCKQKSNSQFGEIIRDNMHVTINPIWAGAAQCLNC